MLKLKRKKGFSLVEVVIALAVIVIVSAGAITIILASFAAKTKTINKSNAQGFADNVWESFKVSQSAEEFESAVSFSEGIELEGVADAEGRVLYTYRLPESDFEARISVDFSDTERDEFDIDIVDDDGDSVISFSYSKGGEI